MKKRRVSEHPLFFYFAGILRFPKRFISRDKIRQQAQQASTRLRILRFSGPLPENSKLLVGIVPNPYEERRRRMANRKRNIQMKFYVTEDEKRLIDEK